MPNYDSDSSDSGDEEYSTTNVVLGYASPESAGDEISHLGGYPTWLDPKSSPPASLAKCKVCNSYMSLLLQLDANLQKFFPHDERRLHLLSCRKKSCSKKSGSIRAFREVRKPASREKKELDTTHAESQKSQPLHDLGSAIFGSSSGTVRSPSNANPFSSSAAPSSQPVNPFASIGSPSSLASLPPQKPVDDIQPPTQSFADKLKIGTNPKSTSTSTPEPVTESWPENSDFPPPYSSFYLDSSLEELEKEDTSKLTEASASKTQYEVEEGAGLEKDTFESSLDKTFQKFSDRIAQNPEQVLRYEFKGEPLLYSGNDNVASRFVVPHGKSGAIRGMPRCEICGAQRVFELQLVPGLIYELEKDEAMDLEDGMEWGTILLGTCVNNCGVPGQAAFREEWVGVQWEERVSSK